MDSRDTLSANERGGGPVDISAKINGNIYIYRERDSNDIVLY